MSRRGERGQYEENPEPLHDHILLPFGEQIRTNRAVRMDWMRDWDARLCLDGYKTVGRVSAVEQVMSVTANSPRSGRKIVAHCVSRGFSALREKSPGRGERGVMPHSFSSLHVHAVFSTKERAGLIGEPIRNDLHAYLGGIIREMYGSAIIVNGTADHVHLLARWPANVSLIDLMRVLKTNSSKWVHEQWPERRSFAWQTGYGAFSVSASAVEDVRRYIEKQEEHHRKRSFQEEFISLLKKHGIEFDERYIWK